MTTLLEDGIARVEHQSLVVQTGSKEVIDVSTKGSWCHGGNPPGRSSPESLVLPESCLPQTLELCAKHGGAFGVLCSY